MSSRRPWTRLQYSHNKEVCLTGTASKPITCEKTRTQKHANQSPLLLGALVSCTNMPNIPTNKNAVSGADHAIAAVFAQRKNVITRGIRAIRTLSSPKLT